MPRGNDAEAAARELRDRYGDGVGNAEDVLRSSAVALPSVLREATLKTRDDEASADLDYGKIEKAAGVEGTVVDASVRGGDTVYVWADDRGALHKGVLVGGKEAPEAVEDSHLARIHNLREQSQKESKKKSSKD
jgi:hypothetical protein